MFSGAFGDYLLDPEVSGIEAPQAEALRGVMRVCGLIRVKGVKKSEQRIKLRLVVQVITMSESRLPLSSCRFVRHELLCFYRDGGWADAIGPGPPLQK